jgi:hypothetical protein
MGMMSWNVQDAAKNTIMKASENMIGLWYVSIDAFMVAITLTPSVLVAIPL